MATTNGTRRRHIPQPRAQHVYFSLRASGQKVYEVRHPRNAAGERPYESVGPSLEAAKERAREVHASAAPRVLSVGTTLSEVARDWQVGRRMKPRSIETFDRHLRLHIEPRLGRVKVRDITPLVIERWLGGLRRADGKPGEIAPGTQRLALATLDMVLQHAVKMSAIPAAPKLDRRSKPKQSEGRRRILTAQEEADLLWACQRLEWLRPIVTVATHQALRLGEVCGLAWEDVDFAADKVRVAQSLGRDGSLGTPKGGKAATIPLSPRAREALVKMVPGPGAQGLIFKNTLGGARQLRDVQRAFSKARTRAGIEVTDAGPVVFHSLRHTGISRIANKPGVPLVHVRDFARHADLVTTQGYVHKIEDAAITAAMWEPVAAGGAS